MIRELFWGLKSADVSSFGSWLRRELFWRVAADVSCFGAYHLPMWVVLGLTISQCQLFWGLKSAYERWYYYLQKDSSFFILKQHANSGRAPVSRIKAKLVWRYFCKSVLFLLEVEHRLTEITDFLLLIYNQNLGLNDNRRLARIDRKKRMAQSPKCPFSRPRLAL